MDILSLLACFRPLVSTVIWRHFSLIVPAVLTMTGRITMLGISRWTSEGSSYRTIQRFFATVLPWDELFARFFETHLFNPFHEYKSLLSGIDIAYLKTTENLKIFAHEIHERHENKKKDLAKMFFFVCLVSFVGKFS